MSRYHVLNLKKYPKHGHHITFPFIISVINHYLYINLQVLEKMQVVILYLNQLPSHVPDILIQLPSR